MVLIPATSTETRDAIEALLMLGDMPAVGNNQPQDNDNAALVPIARASKPSKSQK